MKNWKTTKLESVAEIVMGQSPEGVNYNFDGEGLPLITGAGQFGKLYPKPIQFSKIGAKTSETGDIIICIRATIGDLNLSDKRYFLGRGVAAIRPKIDLDTRFIWHFLKTKKVYLESCATGSTFKQIKSSDLKDLKIPLPPLEEQKRIAAVLDKADEVRAKRRAALEKLDSLLQSVFLDMFGDPFYTKNNSMVAFGTLVKRITYGFTCPMKHLEIGIPILTAKNVQSGFIDFQNVHYADKSEFDALTNKSKPKRGDILITKDGTIGRCAVVDVDYPICINQSVALLETDASKAAPTYLVGYLNSQSVQRALKGMGKGNALQHLQITELAKLPTHSPTLEEQEVYSTKINKIKEIEKAIESSHKITNDLFQSLQQRAFAGELFGANELETAVRGT